MQIKLKSKVKSIHRKTDETIITLEFNGKVVDTKLLNAKDASMEASLVLKTLMADNIKVGSTFTMILSDEGSEEDRIE